MDTPVPQSSELDSSADSATRMRDVHRAVAALRQGCPVVLHGADPWILLAAETANPEGLDCLAAAGLGEPRLLTGGGRAHMLLQDGIPASGNARAIALTPDLLNPTMLHRLADPTLEQSFPCALSAAESPAEIEPAVLLAKLGRLLPCVVAIRFAGGPFEGPQVRVESVAAYPAAQATNLIRVAEAFVPLDHAPDSRVIVFRAPEAGIEHIAILVGRPEDDIPDLPPPLVRVHSECFTGDLLGSLRCDCGPQLHAAIRRMGEEGRGVLLYLAQEGRGIGLVNKLRAYALQDGGLDTVDANRALGWGADERNFLIAATMLRALSIPRIRLLTNNPHKVESLIACGVEVAGRESHSFAPNGVNDAYLATKASRFGHLFDYS